MNGNSFNTDGYTKKLINISGAEEPSADFTKNVMGQILKDPSVNVSFVSKDDMKSNIWLIIAIASMVVGYGIFYFIKNGFDLSTAKDSFETPAYLKVFSEFFTGLFSELSLSPFILLALVGVVLLVVMDKTIVKYLYSL